MPPRISRHTRHGLTLLELMIVLIILVGLIAIVGPRLLGSQKKADIKNAQVQIGNLASALKMYAVDMKTFPLTEEGLELLISPPEDETLAKKWDGPYIEGGKLPKDPWGSSFQYEYVTDSSASDGGSNAKTASSDFPHIFSLGPDRQPGTSDDISNQPQVDDEASNSKSASK